MNKKVSIILTVVGLILIASSIFIYSRWSDNKDNIQDSKGNIQNNKPSVDPIKEKQLNDSEKALKEYLGDQDVVYSLVEVGDKYYARIYENSEESKYIKSVYIDKDGNITEAEQFKTFYMYIQKVLILCYNIFDKNVSDSGDYYAITKKTITITFKMNGATSIPRIPTIPGTNSRSKSTDATISSKGDQVYSGLMSNKGQNTSNTATTSSWNANTSKTFNEDVTYYAIVNFTEANTNFSVFKNSDGGLYIRKYAGASYDNSAISTYFYGIILCADGDTSKFSATGDWKYLNDNTYTLWLKGTNASGTACSNDYSNNFSSPTCNGWVPATWLSW